MYVSLKINVNSEQQITSHHVKNKHLPLLNSSKFSFRVLLVIPCINTTTYLTHEDLGWYQDGWLGDLVSYKPSLYLVPSIIILKRKACLLKRLLFQNESWNSTAFARFDIVTDYRNTIENILGSSQKCTLSFYSCNQNLVFKYLISKKQYQENICNLQTIFEISTNYKFSKQSVFVHLDHTLIITMMAVNKHKIFTWCYEEAVT